MVDIAIFLVKKRQKIFSEVLLSAKQVAIFPTWAIP